MKFKYTNLLNVERKNVGRDGFIKEQFTDGISTSLSIVAGSISPKGAQEYEYKAGVYHLYQTVKGVRHIVYIGQTEDFYKRLAMHRADSSRGQNGMWKGFYFDSYELFPCHPDNLLDAEAAALILFENTHGRMPLFNTYSGRSAVKKNSYRTQSVKWLGATAGKNIDI